MNVTAEVKTIEIIREDETGYTLKVHFAVHSDIGRMEIIMPVDHPRNLDQGLIGAKEGLALWAEGLRRAAVRG